MKKPAGVSRMLWMDHRITHFLLMSIHRLSIRIQDWLLDRWNRIIGRMEDQIKDGNGEMSS